MADYYPAWYWLQPNHYPAPPPQKNQWLPWVIIFLLIVGSFYTVYIYIQPEFVIDSVTCSQRYIVAHLITSKAGRMLMGDFSVEMGPKTYSKKLTASVEEGDRLDVVFVVSLAPGNYEGILNFRGNPIGTFQCTVR